ncbi:hypothetical protein BSKO_06032 [Bryopsis sp. KO-2023]|nr:hypothetical protein BSKO_06032 [Bryopsis sp. KO-2023]
MQNSRLHVRLSSFSHEKGGLTEYPLNHAFNSALEVVFPFSSISCPSYDPRDILGGGAPVFHVVETSLASFLQKPYLADRLKDPSTCFCGLGVGGALDRSDGVCVAPDGTLRLSVTSDTHQRLGLVGRKCTQRDDRFLIDVKLGAKNFGPDRRYYHRVLQCLEKIPSVTMWCLEVVNGIPVAIDAEELGFLKHQQVLCKHTAGTEEIDGPVLQSRTTTDDELVLESGRPFVWNDSNDLSFLHEWLGGISCGVADIDNANVSCRIERLRLRREKWEGMIASHQILAAIEWARDFVKHEAIPWVAIQVWGFRDSPVSWGEVEHSIANEFGGDNNYTLLIFSDDQYCLFTAAGSGDLFAKV